MRVFFVNGETKDYENASTWEDCGSNWVELTDSQGKIVAILNWRQVLRMEPLPWSNF